MASFLPGGRPWPRLLVLGLSLALPVRAQLIMVANENKVDLTTGAPRVIPALGPDSVSFLDFSSFPPRMQTLDNIPNTVIGPPSNLAITPDGTLALVADSIKVDPASATKWIPNNDLHIIDLTTKPAKLLANVKVGQQPSGLSITADGKYALVANRAEGTVTLLSIAGKEVKVVETVKVCLPEESVSDVAISPDGQLALATVQKGSVVAVLKLANGHVTVTGQKISVYGQPYRCVITPDGALGLTAGAGYGNGVDPDAVTVINLKSKIIQATHLVSIGATPESIEISPDGRMLVASVMNGSNLAPDHVSHSDQGGLDVLIRRGDTFEKVQSVAVGACPEGSAFTADGKYLAVPCHPSREVWIFSVEKESLKDTGVRIKMPGFPSSIRASVPKN
jgi:DNA-binding beta-propeller fold protein YncE